MIDDGLHSIYSKLNNDRKPSTLYDRYPGLYRAVVVETNDPLNVNRIRFKCPDMHDFNLKAEDCPWAVPSFPHGGKGSGHWFAPKIGDIIWISFEKQHPYGPVWVGHAEPTRRRFYRLHALFQKTQVFVDQEGKPIGNDNIAYEDYFPKDGRPYSLGVKDRYGSMFVLDETGFFPQEHIGSPAPAGTDAISSSSFGQQSQSPQVNNPDRKMIALVSKYGHYMIMGDQGYDWTKDFTGDFDEDHELEKSRQNNLIRSLNENEPNSANRDQRRIELRTGYGHKFEMRDVGWAAAGPSNSTSRSGDWYNSASQQSNFSDRDERWIKIRSKGGHLIQIMDMGFDPANDNYIRRNRIEEIGGSIDEEDSSWQGRDARMVRIASRFGFKFALDDRGSSPTNAESQENPSGNGWLLKGRKGGRGFGWEVNEKTPLNRSVMYTPKSKIFEMNDRYDFTMLCTDTNSPISRPWMNLSENEFATANAMTFNPQDDTYHLKLDKFNNFVRLKTPALGGINQGFESRSQGRFNTVWTEINDRDNRALILNSTKRFAALHDPRELKFLLINDLDNVILIRNKVNKIQIHAAANVEIKSDQNIVLDAAGDVSIKSGGKFVVNANGGQFVADGSGIGTIGNIRGSSVLAHHPGVESGPGAGSPSPKGGRAIDYDTPTEPPLTPADRGSVFNSPFGDVGENVILE